MNEEITQCDIRIAEIGAECILTEEIVKSAACRMFTEESTALVAGAYSASERPVLVGRSSTRASPAGRGVGTPVPAARIASEAVFHATPRLAATRAIDIRSTTIDLTANMIASRDSFPFDGAAAVML